MLENVITFIGELILTEFNYLIQKFIFLKGGKMQKIFNITGNSIYAEKLYKFIMDYKNIILISLFVGILVNAIDIFTIKYGIDSEVYAILDSTQLYYGSQRYGSWLLYYLIPFARYHIVSQIIGIFALTLAGLLTVSRHNISNNSKLLFVLLFITYPNFAFLQYFYFQSAYNFIGLLFVVIAYRLIEKNNILAYMTAVVLLFIGISSYQSNIAVFLSVMMINVILDYINDKNIRLSIINIIKSTVILIISIIIYYIIIVFINNGINSFHSGYIGYKHGIMEALGNVFKHIWRVLSSNGFQGSHTANIIITVLAIVYVLYFIINYKKYKENIKFIFLMLLWLLSIFSLNLVLGRVLPARAELAIAFYPAFILMLVYYFNDKLKYLVIILVVFIIGFHATYIVKYQMSYYMSHKQDEVTANILINKIYNKYPEIVTGKYKINFIGGLNYTDKHPLRNGIDVFGASFFSWDGGERFRILSFLKLQGFPMDIQLGNITDDMMNNVKDMPVYPDNDCVNLINDTVIVKLSN